VLLIDDDELTRNAAVAALQQVEVPVRTAPDAPQALTALTEHRPDVIVLEPELTGDTTGDDLVNTIKATIEWVDIPIVLFTRADVTSQDEARVRGADEFVLKGPRGAEALVSQVITLFRKG
jgi:two-component system phosphate regulon response regulator PhoB